MKQKNVKIKLMGKIFLISFLFLLVFSLTPLQTQAAGLVHCGWADPNPLTEELEDPDLSTPYNEAKPCEFCDFFDMINGIIQFVMVKIIPVIAVLMLVVGGVFFFFAGTNPSALKVAKGIITSTIIGLVVIFTAFLIVGTILSSIDLADWTTQIYKNWWQDGFFQINCQ